MTRQSPVFKALKHTIERTRDSFILAGVCMVAAWPACHYSAHYMLNRMIAEEPTFQAMKVSVLYQLIMIFSACMISAMVGFLYSDRFGLKGFGETRNFRQNILPYIALGIILIPLSYLLADRELMTRMPEYYPGSFIQAAGNIIGLALAPEVIFRFGLVTIMVYLWRRMNFNSHPWPASILVAAFVVIKVWLDFSSLGMVQGFDLFSARVLVSGFLANFIFGEIYIRKGLAQAIAAHLGLEAKYLIYSFLV